jgi:hypothetical protein
MAGVLLRNSKCSDVRLVLEKIESILPGLAKPAQRLPLLTLYFLFHQVAPVELHRPQWPALVQRYDRDFQAPGIESLIVHLIARQRPGGISLVAHGRSHGRPPRRPVFWIQWHGGVLLTQMLSVCMLVHLLPVQLKYGFMKVADTLTVCLPGVRPSMITQYPAVPVGNSSAPTGRPGGR